MKASFNANIDKWISKMQIAWTRLRLFFAKFSFRLNQNKSTSLQLTLIFFFFATPCLRWAKLDVHEVHLGYIHHNALRIFNTTLKLSVQSKSLLVIFAQDFLRVSFEAHVLSWAFLQQWFSTKNSPLTR